MPPDSEMPSAKTHSGVALPRVGLRERKKERTVRTIRIEAMRLFREQGYAKTTVEQIAEAAEVSASTFFRYFPSKEQLVLADNLDPILIRLIEAQPLEMSPLEAFKRAVLQTFGDLDSEEWAFERERVQLIYSVPELRGAVMLETARNIDMVAGLVEKRIGLPADSLQARAFAGALTGALMTALDTGELDLDRMVQVIDFLAAGMPLMPPGLHSGD